jgi:hypothetical protein
MPRSSVVLFLASPLTQPEVGLGLPTVVRCVHRLGRSKGARPLPLPGYLPAPVFCMKWF